MSDRDNSSAAGKALVALETPRASRAGFSTARPDARLLTQLLAMRHDAPIYRERRRDDPGTASDAYRRAAGLVVERADHSGISI